MSDIGEVHRRTLDQTRKIVAGITAGQWHAPTINGDWDVRALLNHVVSGNWWAAELAAGRSIDEVGDRLDGDMLADDPVAAYDRSASAAVAAFGAPGALDAPCAVSYGPVPGSVYAGHRVLDVLIHGWDLAVATAQDTHLDPTLVAALYEEIEPQLEGLRASGAFGGEVHAPAGADLQTRLLAMLGRRA